MRVQHKAYGEGIVKKISDTVIEVDFGGQLKKFLFPDAFSLYLTTNDTALQAIVSNAKEKAEAVSRKTVPPISPAPQKKYVSLAQDFPRKLNTSYESEDYSPLVGNRAQTISARSEAEMFELIGYMSTPGRVISVEAEVPKDGRDYTFEKLFPGQTYRPIALGDTPSGMPNKLSPQFRINFGSLRNCPEILQKNMGKGNGSCVGRINKSKFVLNIVQNYGFRFGDWQDISEIRKIAEKRGFLEEFENGYKR